jgi:hypothetical protein
VPNDVKQGKIRITNYHAELAYCTRWNASLRALNSNLRKYISRRPLADTYLYLPTCDDTPSDTMHYTLPLEVFCPKGRLASRYLAISSDILGSAWLVSLPHL